MSRIQYTVCRIVFIIFVLFLLNINIIHAGVCVIEHKDSLNELSALQIQKQKRDKWLSGFRERYEQQFREFKAGRSDWRRVIDNRDVVGSKYLEGHEYLFGYDERYDSFWVKDTGVITERGFKTGTGLTVYEVYSINKNIDLEARRRLDMFNSWREKEKEEKEREEQEEEEEEN